MLFGLVSVEGIVLSVSCGPRVPPVLLRESNAIAHKHILSKRSSISYSMIEIAMKFCSCRAVPRPRMLKQEPLHGEIIAADLP
jgi:hypothetical protein